MSEEYDAALTAAISASLVDHPSGTSPDGLGDGSGASMDGPFKLYHYGCDDLDDRGWGCCFRSVQNALARVGRPVPSVADLAAALGRPVSTKPWSEPGEYPPLMRKFVGLKTAAETAEDDDGDGDQLVTLTGVFTAHEGGAVPFAQYTTRNDYAVPIASHRAVLDTVTECIASGGSVVIDDGTQAHSVVAVAEPATDRTPVVLDPHSTDPKQIARPFDMPWLERKAGWMVMFIAPLSACPKLEAIAAGALDPSTAGTPLTAGGAGRGVGSMGIEELSPLLQLLDGLLGHAVPIIPAPAPAADDEAAEHAPASWDLAGTTEVTLTFFSRAHRSLERTLGELGMRLVPFVVPGAADATAVAVARSDGALLTRSQVRALSRAVEVRLAVPEVVLERLEGAAKATMALCVDVIAASPARDAVDEAALRKCTLRPAATFGEDWSVGLETAWMAAGNESVITMPDYAKWTEQHARHRMRSWRGVEAGDEVPWGRLWRFEYWECIRTPCHEVIHLVQHLADQHMSHQLAEHDGAFSTYLLMLAAADLEASRKRSTQGGAGGGSTEAETAAHGGLTYHAGAVEMALLESLQFCSMMMGQETEAARTRWTDEECANYTRWRDGFGATDMSDVWGDAGNFGGDMPRECLCKNMLALEAVCPAGRFLQVGAEDTQATVEAALTTMFVDRKGELDGVAVDIREQVRLSTMSVHDRLSAVGALIAKVVDEPAP